MFIQQSNIETFLKNNKINGISSKEVLSVNMGDHAVATDTKPCLFTYGLGTCIGLIGLADNFAFLSHIDMGMLINDQWEKEFKKLSNGKYDVRIKGCKETIALYDAIYSNREKIKTSIDVILVEGISPVDKENEHRILLEMGLDNLEQMCMRNLGITLNRQIINSSSVLVDSRDRRIILGEQDKINMNTLFEDVLPQFENSDGIDQVRSKIEKLLHINTRDDKSKE